MEPRALTFLTQLLDSPGPSSFEAIPARVWREAAGQFADRVHADVSGNCFATLSGRATPRVMLAGHIDEIGVIVTHIDDDGYLSFDTIGGWDHQVFVGQRVRLLTRQGQITGVIGKKAIHLMNKEDRDKVSRSEDLWIDIGAANRQEAQARVQVADAGVLASGVVEFPNGRIVSRSLDNRVGSFVVLEALRLLQGNRPEAEIVAAVTTREEIGSGGGGARPGVTGIEATVAVVVDVTHATDYPGVEKRKHGDVRLGGGPVITRGASINPVVFELLREAAEAERIPYSVEAAGRDTHTDADNIFTALRGVATGLVSVPLRYMHSPNEMVALEDLERTAQLLAAFARRVRADTDFIPR